MFSIIIPLYNKAPYVAKTIASVQAQTFEKWELIIINDGSTDNSFAIVENAIKNIDQPTYLVNQNNAGVSVARNVGITIAKYENIAFLDADDWWDTTYLERMMSLVESFPDAGIYGCGYYLVKNGLSKIAPIPLGNTFSAGVIDYFQIYANALCMPLTSISVIIPKHIILSEQGFKPALKLGEDFDLWVRIALKYSVAFLNQPLAYYNQDVTPSSRAIGKLYNPVYHILWNLDFLRNEEQTIPALKKLLDNMRVYGLLPYYVNNNYRELARQELSKVDWVKQPRSMKKYYQWPIELLKVYWYLKKVGSIVKQTLINILKL